MRAIATLVSFLLLSIAADAQKITGIWRGYFTSASMARDMPEERYKYEVQIEQLSNNSVKGVTYSYKSTVFYGKAELTGILSMPSRSLIIRETKLLDLKISDRSEPCLMTCYLDYTRVGKLEMLEGTFISVSAKDKRDCGSGKIYLERVSKSDFKKEDFLVGKPHSQSSVPKLNLPKTSVPITKRDNAAVKPVTPPAKTGAKTTVPKKQTDQAKTQSAVKPPASRVQATKPVTKPVDRNATVRKDDKSRPPVSKPEAQTSVQPALPKGQDAAVPQQMDVQVKKLPVPRVLIERENNLVKVINTSAQELVISLYDNGTIDNDTISVYHNNELVISHKKLTYSPITVRIHCNKNETRHELVVVAENLGDIPPNTALMVVTTPDGGRERYEITLASNETRNAKVVINYVPKD
jgi:hypothetical protein